MSCFLKRRGVCCDTRCDTLCQVDAYCAPVYCNIGNVYLRKHSQDGDADHLQQAIDNCTRALKIDDKAFHAMIYMGDALLRLDRESEGLKALYDALKVAPNFPGAHSILGTYFAGKNKLSEVMATLQPMPCVCLSGGRSAYSSMTVFHSV